MKRRDFILKSSLGFGGILLSPYLLESCRKMNPMEDIQFKGTVGIIGAGAAGLYAAYLLKSYGVNVEIFEASNQIGGRVRSLEGFSDFKIDLGAEEVHGDKSIWYDLVRTKNPQFIDTENQQDYYFVNGVLQGGDSFENSSEFSQIENLLESVRTYSGSDISASAYANSQGLPESLYSIWNALAANENGTDATRIGMAGLAFGYNNWSAGEEDYLLSNLDMQGILLSVFSSVTGNVRLNTPIQKVEYGGAKVKLTTTDGTIVEKDRVIITASLNVLFDQLIDFIPQLPSSHLQAIGTLGMGAGMKIILKFSERFWESDTGSIIGDGPVPEFWTTAAGGRSAQNNLLTAFVHGVNAENLLALGDQMIPAVLSQLDTMYGNNIASTLYVDHYTMNWGAEQYIRGTYSYNKPDTSSDARALLSESVNDKIWFAGEACNTQGHHATVHGAMESALAAVIKIVSKA